MDYWCYVVLLFDVVCEFVGDGNFGGVYEWFDVEVLEMWCIVVEEMWVFIEGFWF